MCYVDVSKVPHKLPLSGNIFVHFHTMVASLPMLTGVQTHGTLNVVVKHYFSERRIQLPR